MTSSEDGSFAGAVVGLVVVLAVICMICCRCCKIARRVINSKPGVVVTQPHVDEAPDHVVRESEVDDPTMQRILEDLAREKPIRFTPQQLCTFTSNYSTRLGCGGFGTVYRGEFPNGVKIAVKLLNSNSDGRAEEQFMAEVATIGRTNHRNLVRLYGFCFDQSMSALVYEYMENGSLDKYLFSETQPIEEWEKLPEIAIGTARGIAYLHEECRQRIIHYDIKPGNVLLDEKFRPKVADFGLAKLCSRESSHVTVSGYRGTPGYSAPEFTDPNPKFRVTHKCDVYSFGMLLFEIIGRRRNARTRIGSRDSLDWFPKQVWEEYDKGQLAAMLSGYWNEEEDREQVEKAAMVALWCIQESPGDRPLMSQVVKVLEDGGEMKPPPKPFPSWSTSVTRPVAPPNGSDSSGIFISACC